MAKTHSTRKNGSASELPIELLVFLYRRIATFNNKLLYNSAVNSRLTSLALGLLFAVSSCSSDDDSNNSSSFNAGGSANNGAAAGSGGSSGSGAQNTGGSNNGGSSGTGGVNLGGMAGNSNLLVYGSTDTSLYSMNPETYEVKALGDFDCVASGQYQAMTDIAVNAQGDIWGLTAHNVHLLVVQNDGVVHCADKIPIQSSDARFYALSFAPVGVIDPDKEVMVAGNTDGELWSIDGTGNLVLRGNFGPVPADDGRGHTYTAANVGKNWELSGDIVFFSNDGSPIGFATVRDCPNPPETTGCNYTNTLLEIDMAALGASTPGPVAKSVRGQILKARDCTKGGSGWGNFWGIAAWNDRVFGFSRSGALVDIANSDALACEIENNSATEWSGAGVTTLAPVFEPIE